MNAAWIFTRYASPLVVMAALVSGCNIHLKDNKDAEGGHKFSFSSPLGNMSVRDNHVDAAETGLAVYPGARRVENDESYGDNRNKNQANVNIDTPWFGVRVVAVTFESDDSKDKVWDFYKKEMSHYGRPLECRPGSPDLKLTKSEKEDLTCGSHDRHHIQHRDSGIQIDLQDEELKVGSESRQRIVAFKPHAKATRFAVVYVVTRTGDNAM